MRRGECEGIFNTDREKQQQSGHYFISNECRCKNARVINRSAADQDGRCESVTQGRMTLQCSVKMNKEEWQRKTIKMKVKEYDIDNGDNMTTILILGLVHVLFFRMSQSLFLRENIQTNKKKQKRNFTHKKEQDYTYHEFSCTTNLISSALASTSISIANEWTPRGLIYTLMHSCPP